MRLEALGTWLAVNGDAIYGTRPAEVTKGTTGDGAAVRFTHSPSTGASHAIVRGGTPTRSVVVTGWRVPDGSRVQVSGARPDAPSLPWSRVEAGTDGQPAVAIELPCPQPDGAAFVLTATPAR